MYVCMCYVLLMYVCTYVCMYACMYICIMYECMYVYRCVYVWLRVSLSQQQRQVIWIPPNRLLCLGNIAHVIRPMTSWHDAPAGAVSARLPGVCRVSTDSVRETGDGEKRIIQASKCVLFREWRFPCAQAKDSEDAWLVRFKIRILQHKIEPKGFAFILLARLVLRIVNKLCTLKQRTSITPETFIPNHNIAGRRRCRFILRLVLVVGRDNAVDIATRYGLDGPVLGWDFPYPSRPVLGPSQPSAEWVPGLFPEGRAAGAWRWPATLYNVEVKNRVELYRYSPSVSSWQVIGWIFIFH
jgi:hypothetical protein